MEMNLYKQLSDEHANLDKDVYFLWKNTSIISFFFYKLFVFAKEYNFSKHLVKQSSDTV
jgi:hypothetical protein